MPARSRFGEGKAQRACLTARRPSRQVYIFLAFLLRFLAMKNSEDRRDNYEELATISAAHHRR
jgi:hypothetical protein